MLLFVAIVMFFVVHFALAGVVAICLLVLLRPGDEGGPMWRWRQRRRVEAGRCTAAVTISPVCRNHVAPNVPLSSILRPCRANSGSTSRTRNRGMNELCDTI